MKTKITLLALALGFCLASCDDDLSALPTQEKVEGNLVVDQKSAKIALNGVYYTYAMCGTDNYSTLSTKAAMFTQTMPSNLTGTIDFYQGPMLDTHMTDYLAMYSNYLWQWVYSTLTAANGAISQIDAAPDAWFHDGAKEQYLGDAHFMRALAHYQALRFFCYSWDVNSPYGAILETEATSYSNIKRDRSTVAETYEQIIADLDFAIANAPATAAKPAYACQWTAKGLKARVLMMRGQDSDYADAAALCEDIIAHSPYQLEANVTDIFHSKGLDSPEVMFGIEPKPNQVDVYEQFYYRDEWQYYPSAKLAALFNGDPRRDVQLPDQTVTIMSYGPYGWEYSTMERPVLCKFMPVDKLKPSDTEEAQYQMRLTEMYLIAAEAYARTGNLTRSKELLTTVLSHAGYTDFSLLDTCADQQALLRQVFNEYMRNLFLECGIEHDIMLRFPADITTDFLEAYGDRTTSIFPIPVDEFKYNRLLPKDHQNPGFPAE